MKSAVLLYGILRVFVFVTCLNLEYLDPEQLQTGTTEETQQQAATSIIHKYDKQNLLFRVHVNTSLFQDSKDVFVLYTEAQHLNINASSGIAAVWGFNYFLKKYRNNGIGWGMQHKADVIAEEMPNINEKVVATVRFRYFGDSNAFSFTTIPWDEEKWMHHVDWMALNGINVAFAPVAQEAAWSRVYGMLGMTQDKIDQYFPGPAYLHYHRNWESCKFGGPLPESWHQRQTKIQKTITTYMLNLGMVPVFPTFKGRVPHEFLNLFPMNTFVSDFYSSQCDVFISPENPLFKRVGTMFLNETTNGSPVTHLYDAGTSYLISLSEKYWKTATEAIFSTLTDFDDRAVLLVQTTIWSYTNTETWARWAQPVLTGAPQGRMLVLDTTFYKVPYNKASTLFHGQPSIWNGDALSLDWDVYEARDQLSTIVGLGVTPCEMKQNYRMVEFVLEAGWRSKQPSLPEWLQQYAARRYGCHATAGALAHLHNVSGGYNEQYDVIRKYPLLEVDIKSRFLSYDLFEAWRKFVFVPDHQCRSAGFEYDLIDVTFQALHYRALQLYRELQVTHNKYSAAFPYVSREFIDVLKNIGSLLSSNDAFTLYAWLTAANNMANNDEEAYLYDLNSHGSFNTWAAYRRSCPDIDMAELFLDLYVPRWKMFLKLENNNAAYYLLKHNVMRDYYVKKFERPNIFNTRQFARELYKKYAFMPHLKDLPLDH